MYRVSKVLNNNGVIAINMEENIEYVLLGKGIGFGKKISERFEAPDGCARYSLREDTERGSAKELAKSIAPEYLEIANAILVEAEEKFGRIDRRILFPLADHISFAVERIRHGEQISNPLTEDIRALFGSEYQVASKLKEILKERLSVEIDSHEIGYVALHIHSAIEDEVGLVGHTGAGLDVALLLDQDGRGGVLVMKEKERSAYTVITTGMIMPISFFVRSLNSLVNAAMFTPCWPRAGPTGGAGVALPAGICSFTYPVIFCATE